MTDKHEEPRALQRIVVETQGPDAAWVRRRVFTPGADLVIRLAPDYTMVSTGIGDDPLPPIARPAELDRRYTAAADVLEDLANQIEDLEGALRLLRERFLRERRR